MSQENKAKKRLQIGSQIVGAVVNLVISGLKIYIGVSTNCISILSDGYNNAGDFVGSIGGAVGLGVSGKKPDERYPHGYGRAEQLVTLFLATVFMLVGAYFVYSSVERLFFHRPIIFSWLSFALVAATAVLKAALFFVYYYANKKAPSPIIKAYKLDCVLDTVITTMTLAAYGASALTIFPIDAVFGIVIGCIVLVGVIKLLIKTVRELIGFDDGSVSEEIDALLEARSLNKFAETAVHNYGSRTEAAVFVCGAPDNEVLHELEEELERKNIFAVFITEQNRKGENYEKKGD
jgi:cation diffusion facilitator family transporter